MMISKAQMRGALAMLKMHGSDLAKEVDMSANALNTYLRNDEAGTSTKKYAKIVAHLESRGIEFLPDGAVRLRG